MKAIKLLTLLSVISAALLITSCVSDDDYGVPDISVTDPNIPASDITTFAAVVARYNQAVADGDQIAVFDEEADIYIEGYVVSSDQASNFFEELIVQNKMDASTSTDDPRLGFRIDIDESGLYQTFDVGRKVYIQLNGLAVGEDNGVLAIGKQDGNGIGQIQGFELNNYLQRGSEVVELTPKVTSIGDLTSADLNTLIQLENTQFHRSQLGLTYAGEASDDFDGFRTLESCDDNSTLDLQTSTFADFKSLPVDGNIGSIKGVYSRDFGDDFSVLIINTRVDITFDGIERCDPDFVECTEPSGGGATFWSDNFESYGGNMGNAEAAGWTNVNVSGGDTDFFLGNFDNNTYAQISGFNADEDNIDVWLVSPTINMDGTTGEELSFDVQTNFNNGNILSVLISTNFTGDVADAEWQILDAAIPTGSSNGFGNFETVGPINIACLDGDINIAFVYEGSDPSATTRYHIDNLEVTGN
ncbi:MAG: hypothetical protein BM564_06095 [Bacteroidetes bacterium MedPE-SWsnd-G2]|nr:MAG: hypothetical protein BM564_06095 [Bacteroidetes bacterium MedPE-SWsnd-G2]